MVAVTLQYRVSPLSYLTNSARRIRFLIFLRGRYQWRLERRSSRSKVCARMGSAEHPSLRRRQRSSHNLGIICWWRKCFRSRRCVQRISWNVIVSWCHRQLTVSSTDSCVRRHRTAKQLSPIRRDCRVCGHQRYLLMFGQG
jgi:hypothetical protein